MKKSPTFYQTWFLKINLWLLFFLSITTYAQILQVKGNNIVIANNDITPDILDHTDFGSVPVNTVKGTTFFLKNNSGTNLTFTGSTNVTLSGTNANQFSITSRPSNNLTLTGNTYTILEVSFNPTSTGLKSARININLSTGSPNPYRFNIQGTGGAAITPEFTMSQVVPNDTFDYPYELIYAPDNYLWLTERNGKKIKRVDPTTGTIDLLVDMTSLVYQNGGQDGLMGMALHPQFLQGSGNDYLYVAYTYGTSDSNRRTKIVRYTYSITGNDGTLSNPIDLIIGLSGSNDHNSGRMQIGPDYKIYYTIGDQGANQFGNKCKPIKSQLLPTQSEIDSQNYATYEGKILRINLDGTIPLDNPILNGVKSHIYSYGHRNCQGIVFGTNGVLYANEHGAKSDDEINIIHSGDNYGWPHISGYRDDKNYSYCNWSSASNCTSLSFNDYTCGTGITPSTESSWLETHTEPINTLYTIDDGFNFTGGWLTWPTVAPSSIILYEGYSNPISGWENTLISTTLKKGKIYKTPLSTDGLSVIGESEELLYTQNRYRDIAIHPNGKIIYIITDSGGTTSGPSGSSSLTVTHPGTILVFTHDSFLSTTDFNSENIHNVVVFKSQNQININSKNNLESIEIFDLLGREIYSCNNIDKKQHTIDSLQPKNQILIVKIKSNNNQIISKKILF